MSFIEADNSSFVIFGCGNDDTMPDSGEGAIFKAEEIPFTAGSAAFDITGRYCWLTGAYRISNGIHKFDLWNDWEEVPQTLFDPDTPSMILHPVNSDNNIGIALVQREYMKIDFTLFDLTDETVIRTGTVEWNLSPAAYECVLIGDHFYFIQNGDLWSIDMANQTLSIDHPERMVSFVDDNGICSVHDITWFSDWARYLSFDYSLNLNWEVMAQQSGSGGFGTFINFGAKGKIYGLSDFNGVFKLGEYRGDGTSDFYTPTPTKIIKSDETFTGPPTMSNVAFANNKDYACFWLSGYGLYYTDYNKMMKLDEPSSYHGGVGHPLCMDGHHILAIANDLNTMIYYTYR